jgi:hypothetical protein
MPDRKPFLLRIDRALLDELQRWANDDLRSLNGQIEVVLRRALEQSGRGRRAGGTPDSDESGRAD